MSTKIILKKEWTSKVTLSNSQVLVVKWVAALSKKGSFIIANFVGDSKKMSVYQRGMSWSKDHFFFFDAVKRAKKNLPR